jgi:hypothetical protein
MNVEIDLTFPHHYTCEVLDELPGMPESPRHFFPGDQPTGRDGVTVLIRPQKAPAWIGTFSFGKFGSAGVTKVLSMPNPHAICVVSRGLGHVVTAQEPGKFEVVRVFPIIDVRSIPSQGLVVFANNTELLAHGDVGVRWRTKRISWDGLTIISVADRLLVGQYWDIRDERERKFEVDLATGAVQGAAEVDQL